MSDTAVESSAIETPEGAKKKLDPGFSRNLKIIGGAAAALILLVVCIVLFSSGDGNEKVRVSKVDLGNTQATNAGGMSPAMEGMVRDQQVDEAREAARRGQSYIPPDTTGRLEPVVVPAYQSNVGPPPTPSTYSQAAIAVNQQEQTERDGRRREGLDRQLRAFLDGATSESSVRERIEADSSTAAVSPAVAAARAEQTEIAATRVTAGTPASTEDAVIDGLEIVAAELASDLNVPANATVFASAVVNAGAAKGAYLIGSARVVDESLEITFKQMRLGKKVYQVDAIVLDQGTASNAIAGSVDRRLLQRYVMPIALATAQGFFAAKAQTGSVAVAVGDSAAITQPPSTNEQARSAGIAAGLGIGQAEVQRMAQQPIVVAAPKRTAVGILFRAPVTEAAR